jgi:hypothetical protein
MMHPQFGSLTCLLIFPDGVDILLVLDSIEHIDLFNTLENIPGSALLAAQPK